MRDVATIFAEVEEIRGAEARAGKHGVVVIFFFGAGPGGAFIGGFDEAGVDGSLAEERVVGIAAVGVAGDEAVEVAVDAFLPEGFPSGAVGFFGAAFSVVVHG